MEHSFTLNFGFNKHDHILVKSMLEKLFPFVGPNAHWVSYKISTTDYIIIEGVTGLWWC